MKKYVILGCIIAFLSLTAEECAPPKERANTSNSGVQQAYAKVQTDLSGHTVEQNNIAQRLLEDNKPGSIKHLYIISAYSGEVLLYSTVKGKVTSSGKRLSPTQVVKQYYQSSWEYNPDLIQDDGTYGSSVEYVYWWDSKGVYHQQYITGGMIMHISNQPIAVKSVTINLELTK